jgi:hypothetical protein
MSLGFRVFVAFLLLNVFSCAFARAGSSGLAQLSAVCGTESRPGWRQIFAFDGSEWKRFGTLSEIPVSQEKSARLAQVWQGPMEMTLVAVNANVDETFVQTSYCFRGNGQLLAWTHEVRALSGLVYLASKRYDTAGGVAASSNGFFDAATRRRVRRLKSPGKEAPLLEPTLYRRFEDLPFANLYHPLTETEKY